MMKTVREPSRDIPVIRQVDVLVAGGGPAGFVAAVAAARAGAKTLLVERYGCLGGLATGGLVLYMDAIADKEKRRVIGGMPWEVLERLRAMNGLAIDAPLRLHADSEVLKVLADRMCVEADVELLLHCWAVDALVGTGPGGRRQVEGVVVESKAGRQAILSKVCIDATGDGDIAARAGASFELDHQCIGLNLKVGGVDRECYRAFERDHPDEATGLRQRVADLGGVPLRPNSTPDSDAGVYWINILGLSAPGELGRHSADLHETFAGTLSAINVSDLSHAEVELRRRIWTSLGFYRENVPGFENLRLLAFASQLGVRESRRIHGIHELCRDDILSETAFPDAIGTCGISYAAVGSYQVPYRSLVPRDLDGLLTAGRCISTDHWTMQALRLIPPAMVVGQGAGTAAAMAVQQHLLSRDIDASALHDRLVDQGVLF